MKKKKKLPVILVLLSVFCLLAASITAYASWAVTGSTNNFIGMASFKNEITEQYSQPGSVDPSQEVTKIVNVKNTGNVASFVRVQIEKQIGDLDGNGVFVKDESLDPEKILITFNNTMWADGHDGYFYYREALEAGETTKEPLMESFVLSADAGNAYKGKQGHIIVRMESVQAEGGADIWNISDRKIISSYKGTSVSEATSVTFLGKDKGFDIEKSQTDLFASFKNLTPGCSRTQEIIIRNTSGEEVEITLHAEPVDQEKMSAEQLALVEQLINKYAVIRITQDGKVLYEGPVSGTAEGNNMRRAASLGSFRSGASEKLVVKLELSPEMDNQYMDLLGKIRWVFTAKGEDAATPVSTDTPSGGTTGTIPVKTGDPGMAVFYAALLSASALFLAAAAAAKMKERKNG